MNKQCEAMAEAIIKLRGREYPELQSILLSANHGFGDDAIEAQLRQLCIDNGLNSDDLPVFGIPPPPLRIGEIPGRSRCQLVHGKDGVESLRDGDRPISFRLRLPELSADGLRSHVDHLPVQINVRRREPERFFSAKAGVDVDGDQGPQLRLILQRLELRLYLLVAQPRDDRRAFDRPVHSFHRIAEAAVGADVAVVFGSVAEQAVEHFADVVGSLGADVVLGPALQDVVADELGRDVFQPARGDVAIPELVRYQRELAVRLAELAGHVAAELEGFAAGAEETAQPRHVVLRTLPRPRRRQELAERLEHGLDRRVRRLRQLLEFVQRVKLPFLGDGGPLVAGLEGLGDGLPAYDVVDPPGLSRL